MRLKLRRPNARLFNLLGVVIGLAVLFVPARQLVAQQSEIDDLRDRRDLLHSEAVRLEAELGFLESPEGIEVAARERLGLVRPDEQAYFFVYPGGPQDPAESTAPDETSGPARAWQWFVDLLRGGK